MLLLLLCLHHDIQVTLLLGQEPSVAPVFLSLSTLGP